MTKIWGFHNQLKQQPGFAILHQPRPRVLPRCRQLAKKRKRKPKPGKICQRLLQSKAKQFWYQLAWFHQLWKNYEATTTIIATMTPRLMAAARRKIGRRPTILKQLILYIVKGLQLWKVWWLMLLAEESRSNGWKRVDGAVQDEDAAHSVDAKGTSDETLKWNQ